MKTKKPKHGGKREGAGRPASNAGRIRASVFIKPEALAQIDELAKRLEISRPEALERCIEAGVKGL